MKILNK